MAEKYRHLIHLWPLMTAIAIAAIILDSGLFRISEILLIFTSFLCAAICLRLHIRSQRPESLVIIAAVTIFLIAYLAQAILFLTNLRSNHETLSEVLSIRSVFSLAALSAGPNEVDKSLLVVLTGFIGILLPAIYFSLNIKIASGTRRYRKNLSLQPRVVVSNPLAIGYIAMVGTIFFSILRKYLGLDSAAPSGLPFGIGGAINITSAYIGPNLLFAALFFALDHGSDEKARHMIWLSLGLSLFNYILFTSKMSLIFPFFYILLCQHILGRRLVSVRAIGLFFGILVVAYPFLNLYRSAIALGVAPGDIISTIADLYASANASSDIDRNVLQVGVGAIIGRFVGYDPLLILLQASPYTGSLLEYFLHGDLDKYLTYTILDFSEGMGYSPGFLGRFFYISNSYVLLLILTSVVVLVIVGLVRGFWRGNVRQKFMVPLLLAYCLIFFTDGIRFELVRSLFLSSLFIFGILRVFSTIRTVTSQNG